MFSQELQTTINDMVQSGRGILAADESTPTIGKRFKTINVVGSANKTGPYLKDGEPINLLQLCYRGFQRG